MSDFRFSCPGCGQHIACDRSLAGERIQCPLCGRELVVPQAPAGTFKGLKIDTLARTTRRIPAKKVPPPAPKLSRLALASLLFSLSIIFFLPGIVCGYFALATIKQDPRLKGAGLARAGMIIGYVVLGFLLLGIAIRFALDAVKALPEQGGL